MQSGFLDLTDIIEFVRKNNTVPCGRGKEFLRYSKLCDSVTMGIPITSGWYFWVDSKKTFQNPIYIGKAEKTSKSNSLRYRIAYELKTERVCFWADIVGPQKAFYDQHLFFKGKYDLQTKRALKKTGTRYIFWVSDTEVTSSEIAETERMLIKHFNPVANSQRAKPNRAQEKHATILSLIQNLT